LPIHYRALALGLARKGHQITVLYTDRFGSTNQLPQDDGITFIPVKFKLPAIFHKPFWGRILKTFNLTEKVRFHEDGKLIARTIHQLDREKRFDIFESPNNGATLQQFLKGANRNRCCIRIATTDKEHSTINQTESSPYLSELFKAEGKTFRQCQNLVTHTRAHRDLICREYGVDKEMFSIIPLSVRVPSEDEIAPTANPADTVVLFVGRFEKRKGIDVLLEMIPEILFQNQKVIFRLVGPDPNDSYRKEFEKDHPKLKSQVLFLGEKTGGELDEEYKNCDIFIAPSRYESFGLIYAEAMSFGKPAIGTDVGGIPEVIEHEKTGFLCINEDVKSFVDALLNLIDKPDLAKEMGRRGRERVIQFFDMEKLIRDTEKYYLKIGKIQAN